MKVTYEKNGHNYDREWSSLPAVAQEYLSQYGWQQSLADSHASVITKVMTQLADAAKEAGQEFPAPKSPTYKALAESEEVLKLAKPLIHDAITKRIQRILDGKMAIRETDPFVVECRKVAVATIVESAAKEGVKLPDRKSDDWKELVEAVMGTDTVQAEAKKRLARPLPKVDLKSILAAKAA